MNQDAGTPFSRCRPQSLKMQAKITTTLVYPSRCRFSAKTRHWLSSLDTGPKDVTPIVVAMLWSNHCNHLRSIYQLIDKSKRTEKLKIYCSSSDNQALHRFRYPVALRFQTTDGCSSSSANKRNYICQPIKKQYSWNLRCYFLYIWSIEFPVYPSVVNLFSIFVKRTVKRICLKGIYNSYSEFTFHPVHR